MLKEAGDLRPDKFGVPLWVMRHRHGERKGGCCGSSHSDELPGQLPGVVPHLLWRKANSGFRRIATDA
jgi:hypothetical protein